MNRFLGKAAVSILSESLQLPPNYKFVTDKSLESHRTTNTFERTATGSESPLHSRFIHTLLLPPEMFTRPWQDANDSLFILRPWYNAIRVRTPPDMCLIYSQVVWRSVISSHDLRSLKVHGTFRKMFVLLKVTICVFVELTDRNWPKRWMNLGVQVYQVQGSRVHLYQGTTKWSKFKSFRSLKMHYESSMRLCTCTTTNKVENIPNCLLRGRMISA